MPGSQDKSPQAQRGRVLTAIMRQTWTFPQATTGLALGGHRTQAALWPHTGPKVISKPTSSLTSVFSSQAT